MTRILARAPIFARAPLSCRSRKFTSTTHRYKRSKVPKLNDVEVVDFQAGIDSNFQAFNVEEIQRDVESAKEEAAEAARQMTQSNSLIKAVSYGSASEKSADRERSFSQYLANGQKTHEITFHWVKPSRTKEYIQLMQDFHRTVPKAGANSDSESTSAEAYVDGNGENMENGRLLGAWKAVVGTDLDTYVHIWEYPNIASLHKSARTSGPEYEEFSAKSAETLRQRSCEIVQEFAFWGGTARARDLGGIFELRKYDSQPGKMSEWEFYWRRGIEYRREVMEPVGAWFTNIGPLNRVYHLWQFTDSQHRKISRDRSWEKSGWAETTKETVKSLNKMESIILLPLDYSPLK